MMKELKNMQKGLAQARDGELWCTDCRAEGHTKGSCSKKQFCDICQIVGHSTKECLFNMKTKGHRELEQIQIRMQLPEGTVTTTNVDGEETITIMTITGAVVEYNMMLMDD